ncbi:MAG: ATP-grasp domain-containing protein [Olegusella sp.]|nr:ATP-grasp domain-containing protein [Olegusella sp.]
MKTSISAPFCDARPGSGDTHPEAGTLLILGAGIYQVPLIKTARAMGLRTVVASIPGSYPGFAWADEVRYIDTRDKEGVLAAAREIGACGIITTGTDVAVRSIGYACEHLGLPGISYEAARILTDKALMKESFRDGGVHTSEFEIVHDEAEALDAAHGFGYPVMVKAVDVSGSRGIARVSDDTELLRAFSAARSVSHTDHFLVERVARGTEIGLDAFVWDGVVTLCLPHVKYVYRTGGVTMPVGHGFPYVNSPETLEALREEVARVASATGADNCALNLDLFVDEDGSISIIEAGGRCGATTIPELIELHTGIDYYRQMIRAALGERPELTPVTHNPCIGLLLCAPCSGVITSIDQHGIEALCNDTQTVSLDYGVGDYVHTMRNGTDRIGQLTICTSEVGDAERLAQDALSCVRIETADSEQG